MKQATVTRIVIAVGFGLVLLFAIRRSSGSDGAAWPVNMVTRAFQSKTTTPEESIYAMLDAARSGDPAAYLDCYTGSMRDQLRQTISEQGQPVFDIR